MDASGADKLILLVQTNQVLYDKSAAEYKVKDALEKGDIWQIGVDIAVNSERTTDLRCRFSFLVSWWRCDRCVRFLVSRFSFLVPRFSFLGGGVTGPLVRFRTPIGSDLQNNSYNSLYLRNKRTIVSH